MLHQYFTFQVYKFFLVRMIIVKVAISIILLITTTAAGAQKLKDFYKPRLWQFSIVPGMSTNGINSGGYINGFSFNLLSGYSGGNNIIEIGGISNFNETNVMGFQAAGFANIVGGNVFNKFTNKEKLRWIQEGLTSDVTGLQIAGFANFIGGGELPRFTHKSNFTGLQIAGFINNVVGYVTGLQLTAGFNAAQKGLLGIQIAGLSNQCDDQAYGFQFAGLRNAAVKGVDGGQLSLVLNSTKEVLIGYQVGLLNLARKINGKNISLTSESNFGTQIGVFNKVNTMNGLQFGILNFGKEMNGVQVGVINIYEDGDGIPIGLLNFGNGGHTRIYGSELFLYNIEKGTGNCTNCHRVPRIFNSRLTYTLLLGYNPDFYFNGLPRWGVGYGFGKSNYRVDLFPYNEQWFYDYDVQLLHFNREQEFSLPLNLVVRLRTSIGYRLSPRIQKLYIFGGLAFNYQLNNHQSSNRAEKWWPGVNVGLHFH